MLTATQQMPAAHALKDVVPAITVKGEVLERISSFKLLDTWLNEHLKWADHIRMLSSSCYAVWSVFRKLKNLAPYNVRKQLVECLVLSKLDYNDVVCYPLPNKNNLELTYYIDDHVNQV